MTDELQQIRRSYSHYESGSARDAMPRFDAQLRTILHFLPMRRDTRILDAGCGAGGYANHLVRTGYTAVQGVDLFERIAGAEFPYTCASIGALPFSDDSFDFAYSASVIYYLDDLSATFGEFRRVLTDGATLIFTGHTYASPATLYRKWLLRRDSPKAAHLRHARLRPLKAYQQAAQGAGFRLELTDGFGAIPGSRRFFTPAARHIQRRYGFKVPYRTAPNSSVSTQWIQRNLGYHFIVVATAV